MSKDYSSVRPRQSQIIFLEFLTKKLLWNEESLSKEAVLVNTESTTSDREAELMQWHFNFKYSRT